MIGVEWRVISCWKFIQFCTKQHQLHILVNGANAHRMGAPSSSKNTVLRAKVCKLGETNTFKRIFGFELLIQFFQVA